MCLCGETPDLTYAAAYWCYASSSLLVDFGQTSVKRGYAHYQDGQLTRLDVWPDAPSVCPENSASPQSDAKLRQRWQQMATIIASIWAAAPPLTVICISLACYLFEGHPSPRDQGCYGALQRLGPHQATFIGDGQARRLAPDVTVALMRDEAAAAVYAGEDRAVVITLGTAIGNGFPPAKDDLRPIARYFALTLPSSTHPLRARSRAPAA